MAKGIEPVGDTGLEMTLEFPDAKMRDDFEVAFRGWIKQYQQAAATHRLVGALAQKELADEGEDDTSGYLSLKTLYYIATNVYYDFIPRV